MARRVRPDYAAVRGGELGVGEAFAELDRDDLIGLTNDFYGEFDAILGYATDAEVRFVPRDPSVEDAVGWTIAHAVAHLTATAEGSAAQASSLARGLLPEGPFRYEVPEADLADAEAVRRRLAESHRMCLGFLDTWPDKPHLDLTMVVVPRFGPLNAIGRHGLGLLHGDWHVAQLRQTRLYAQATGASSVDG